MVSDCATGSRERLEAKVRCHILTLVTADLASAFPSGMNSAATWSRRLIRAKGKAMGAEFRDKGIDVQLGPVGGGIGRNMAGGRNWEGELLPINR